MRDRSRPFFYDNPERPGAAGSINGVSFDVGGSCWWCRDYRPEPRPSCEKVLPRMRFLGNRGPIVRDVRLAPPFGSSRLRELERNRVRNPGGLEYDESVCGGPRSSPQARPRGRDTKREEPAGWSDGRQAFVIPRGPRTRIAMIDPTTNPGSEEHESTERYDIEVAPRVRNLPPYLFGKINELKYRKRRAGIDVIDLGMGNPTDPPEQWVDRQALRGRARLAEPPLQRGHRRLQPAARGRRPSTRTGSA